MKHHIQQIHEPHHSRRGGAVIIVVISLLTTLVFLGLFFFNWTSQEIANAELFADPDQSGAQQIDPNPIFDRAAEQLIVGTRDGDHASALWGGIHSLLAHQIGRIDGDLRPTDTNVASGRGIVMEVDDVNDDGVIDPLNGDTVRFRYVDATGSIADDVRDYDDFRVNWSSLTGNTNPPRFRPNVDYTYPDINNLFLAHDETATVIPGTTRRVYIPSFFRPQLFPEYRSTDDSESYANLYNDVDKKTQSLRPNRGHRYSTPNPAGDDRYLTSATTAFSGDTTRTLQPFPFPASDANGKMGIFNNKDSNALGEYTLLDADVDGDGTADAIWIDLDLPMIHLSDGAQFVPLASFKVIDADGLINLNAHGNLQGWLKASRTLDGTEPTSVSNQGMSRSEVNPLWSMGGDLSGLSLSARGDALRNMADRFGFNASTTTPSPIELANMEWSALLMGWNPQNVSGQPTLGRYGDRQQLQANQSSPRAGIIDEDFDGDNAVFGKNHTSQRLPGLPIPGFRHPLSAIGTGIGNFISPGNGYLTHSGSTGGTRQLGQPFSTPVQWPQYVQFLASNYYPASLNTSALPDALLNEEDETILEQGHYYYGTHDSPFPAAENMALHLGKSDLQNLPIDSRVRTLASANFQHAANADDIRSRFTTDSWDRLEFNYSFPSGRSWEIGAGHPDWNGSTGFPPWYGSTTTLQPFRPELRQLFRTVADAENRFDSYRNSPRHRLTLNGILSNDLTLGGSQANGAKNAFENGSPRYRELVPHPTSFPDPDTTPDTNGYLTTGMVHDEQAPGVPFDVITSNPYAQEWWARYDRQRLARDIYCLLWVLGSEGAAPNSVQAREMAQFAVNVVDAMDQDDVITRFEYDPNLADGWDTNIANLGVVYGIEHQQLVFSEWLLIETNAENSGDDSNRTLHNDEGIEVSSVRNGHRFLYLELRNSSPYEVPLDDETWRIARFDGDTLYNAVEFRGDGNKIVGPGETFLIGCHDGKVVNGAGNPIGSAFFANVDGSATAPLRPIIPFVADPEEEEIAEGDKNSAQPPPLMDLDLTHENHETLRRFSDPNRTLVELMPNGVSTRDAFTLRLQRRKNLNARGSGESEWIEVDRITVNPVDFSTPITLGASPSGAALRAQLENRKSMERAHPFTSTASSNNGTADLVKHSMKYRGAANENSGPADAANDIWTGGPFTYWQPHFDRNFSSVMELLSIPLYGNRDAASTATFDAPREGGVVRNLVTANQLSGLRTAQVRFLNPSNSYPAGHYLLDSDVPHYANRWYRLLEFVEVKSQDQLRIDPQTAVVRRTPGRVNLNTIRHESVLAGLIDDPHHINPISRTDMTNDLVEYFTWPSGVTQGTGRHWYQEHRLARDGRDSFMMQAARTPDPDVLEWGNILIPGGYGARPFRSLSYLNSSETLIENLESTILRRRDTVKWFEDTEERWHGLYEARASDDVGVDDVDYHTKNRILGKIANNSTTRSHVFFVWIGLDFFEAHRNANNHIQIGAKTDDTRLPQFRLFCVVDMSRLEEAYNPVTGTFDFRKFIIHRQLLP